eukprot:3720000-Pyramimonas_sp.AAC.1
MMRGAAMGRGDWRRESERAKRAGRFLARDPSSTSTQPDPETPPNLLLAKDAAAEIRLRRPKKCARGKTRLTSISE